jgi:hypothetical protein
METRSPSARGGDRLRKDEANYRCATLTEMIIALSQALPAKRQFQKFR